MKRFCPFLLLILLPWTQAGNAEPIGGSWRKEKLTVPGGSPGHLEFQEQFKGGKRACIIVLALEEKAPSEIGIQVFDPQKKLVAQDKGRTGRSAVIWYPPRDEMYSIKVLNSGDKSCICYMAVK